jgi:divalent metal cation (Fe/Co/Zn/Cd) transporter
MRPTCLGSSLCSRAQRPRWRLGYWAARGQDRWDAAPWPRAYIVIDAGRRLLGFGAEAQESKLGIALTAVSLVVMPLLGWVKLRAAASLSSGALRADAYETITCAWLSLTTLLGLILNAAFGWWWADPLAALAIVPLALREGLEAGAVSVTRI